MDKQFLKRVRRKDTIAKTVIQVCGVMVIVCVLAILALVVKVALPIFAPSSLLHEQILDRSAAAVVQPVAIGIGSYGEAFHVFDRDGSVAFLTIPGGEVIQKKLVRGGIPGVIKVIEQYKNSFYNILWQDGSMSMVEIRYQPQFDADGKRTIEPLLETVKEWPAPADGAEHIRSSLARVSEEKRYSRIDLLDDNTFAISHEVTTTDIFDNQTTETKSARIDEAMPGRISAFTVDDRGAALYAGTDTGYVVRWDLTDSEAAKKTDTAAATSAADPITAVGLVFGGQSLLVGARSGAMQTWMPVPAAAGTGIRKMEKVHVFTPHAGAVTSFLASSRDKTFYSLSAAGSIHADHMTSENHLFAATGETQLFSVSQKDNALIALGRDGRVRTWEIHNPHPEISLKTLFGKVWYEGYPKPEFVWQSSSQSDDAEPKLSLIPLIFGTMKGTLYAMLFSIPVAIFGAVYTSQFTSHRFRRNIKPVIEIMASVPSVVIGFLIALWLAPLFEASLFAIVVGILLLPLLFTALMIIVQPFYRNRRFVNRIRGYEFLLLMPVFFVSGWLAMQIAPPLETALFDGNFALWLYHDLGMRYDQRNCIIIAFGLGICVIPIIFSITEDAISNIPPSLTAASLALGASRWQTVWRVILPSASPGIFAAMIIGFGRAVGETMVVLMATGNTPIMDWSIFNGMRTLSANIAVEIPEAPVGGSLYRVLFLCATVLFSLTFILNTGAEIIREHLRKKYGRY